MDQPTRLSLASAGSAAVKPGPSKEVRLPYYAIIRRNLHQQVYDHELQRGHHSGDGGLTRLDVPLQGGRQLVAADGHQKGALTLAWQLRGG